MDPTAQRQVDGFKASYVVIPDQRDDEVWLLAVFEDEASYKKNAASPEQNKEYMADRLAALGGELFVDSRPGEGTLVEGRLAVPSGVASSPVTA